MLSYASCYQSNLDNSWDNDKSLVTQVINLMLVKSTAQSRKIPNPFGVGRLD
jgi:hypothetical protein